MRSVRRARWVAAVALLAMTPALVASARQLEPLVVGWEQVFRLEWEVGERRQRPVLRGHVANDSPYTMTGVRLLVDGLDAGGRIVAQKVSWVPGDLSPFSWVPFEASAPGHHPGYRVRVFAFDRLEADGPLP